MKLAAGIVDDALQSHRHTCRARQGAVDAHQAGNIANQQRVAGTGSFRLADQQTPDIGFNAIEADFPFHVRL
jgi:hypothetical protein